MNQKIPFNKFATSVAEAAGLPLHEVETFMKEVFEQIEAAILEGETVKVKGIGTFVKSSNSSTPILYIPDAGLADAINAPFAPFQPEEVASDLDPEMFTNVPTEKIPVADLPEEVYEAPAAAEVSVTDVPSTPPTAPQPQPRQYNWPTDDDEEDEEPQPEPRKPQNRPVMPVQEPAPLPAPQAPAPPRVAPAPVRPAQSAPEDETEGKMAGFGLGFLIGFIIGAAVAGAAVFGWLLLKGIL